LSGPVSIAIIISLEFHYNSINITLVLGQGPELYTEYVATGHLTTDLKNAILYPYYLR